MRSYVIKDPDNNLLLNYYSEKFSNCYKRIIRSVEAIFAVFVHSFPETSNSPRQLQLVISLEFKPAYREAILTSVFSGDEAAEAKLNLEILRPVLDNQWQYKRNDKTVLACPYCGAIYVYRLDIGSQNVPYVECQNCGKEFQAE